MWRVGAGGSLAGFSGWSITHLELYREATRSFFGSARFAFHVPQRLAGLRERWGRYTGHMPFERSWMADYIDLRLDVDASRTRRRIDWAPNSELHILKRIPHMIQHMRNDPAEWELRSKRKKARGTEEGLESRLGEAPVLAHFTG